MYEMNDCSIWSSKANSNTLDDNIQLKSRVWSKEYGRFLQEHLQLSTLVRMMSSMTNQSIERIIEIDASTKEDLC